MCFWRKKPKREKCVECGYIFTPEDMGDKCPMCKTYRRCPFCQNKKIERIFPSSMMAIKTIASLEFQESIAPNQFTCKKCGRQF